VCEGEGSSFDGSADEGSVAAAPVLLIEDESIDDVELDVADDTVDEGSGDLPEL
jgi:hypothetical protein